MMLNRTMQCRQYDGSAVLRIASAMGDDAGVGLGRGSGDWCGDRDGCESSTPEDDGKKTHACWR